MQYFKIELDGNHFVESYLVYVIEISHGGYNRYFYVGQTGDRNHFTARPAFRRLSAHLSDQGRSTENQLYRYIATKILKHQLEKNKAFETGVKTNVGEFLKKAKICMHVFPIRAFESEMISQHKTNREYVESIEVEVIAELSKRFGPEAVLNSRLPKANRKIPPDIDETVRQILNTAFP